MHQQVLERREKILAHPDTPTSRANPSLTSTHRSNTYEAIHFRRNRSHVERITLQNYERNQVHHGDTNPWPLQQYLNQSKNLWGRFNRFLRADDKKAKGMAPRTSPEVSDRMDSGTKKGYEDHNDKLSIEIEEGKGDNKSEEGGEGQTGGFPLLGSVIAFPTERRLFQAFKETFNRLINPTTTIEEAIGCQDIEALQHLLKTRFDAVAQGKYAWIRELDDIGYTRDEIADLLFEQTIDAPWIYFNPNIFDVGVQAGIHLPGCAHQYLSSKKCTPDQTGSPPGHNFPIMNWQDIMESVQELCGLAGIAPISRDLEKWN